MWSIIFLATPMAAIILPRQDDKTTVVHLSQDTGESHHVASGVLYGLPLNIDQIPDKWYTGMDYGYSRGGGSAQTAGGTGYLSSIADYQIRFEAILDGYRTVRKYNGSYIVMLSDLWGADGGQAQSDGPYPGDEGNWTLYDNFLNQLVADIKSNDAAAGISLDLWNEPNGDIYWNRSQNQFNDMWGRGYLFLRNALPGTHLNGPAANWIPALDDSWWPGFASFVSQNQTPPDEWTWHILGNVDLVTQRASLHELLDFYSLPHNSINIDEYGLDFEQTPVFSAWYISQFERINTIGLRSCWIPAFQAYDMISGLLTKPNADNDLYDPSNQEYHATGQYLVYQYYGSTMTGHRVATDMSGDKNFDVYATVDGNSLKMLYGSRQQTIESHVQVNDLDVIGLPESGTLKLKVLGFPFPTGWPHGRFVAVDQPLDIGTFDLAYSGNSITFSVYPADNLTSYAFEISN